MAKHTSYVMTAEAVTEGHPDKLADQISDAVLDSILLQDPEARVACEVFNTTGLVVVGGEISTTTYVDIPSIARRVINGVGYNRAKFGFDGDTCCIMNVIDEQSKDISQGVTSSLEQRMGLSTDRYDNLGAGDIGIMLGYACDETEACIPTPLYLARKLVMRLSEVRRNGVIPYLRPDGKAQVTVRYEDDEPVSIETVVVNAQHDPDIKHEKILEDIIRFVIRPSLPIFMCNDDFQIYVNETGSFVLGGPHADTGLTGRKLVVDNYGPGFSIGGGAFSGKDPTKVDRSGAYMARYVAKHVVASGAARKCQIEVSYSIGVASPVSLRVETFGTGKFSHEVIESAINEVFDFRPLAIIEELHLREPQYERLAQYGHMGRIDLTPMPKWEEVSRLSQFGQALELYS